MEKFIIDYLNITHPNIYLLRTKFGDDICGYDENNSWLYLRRDILKTVMSLFSCNFLTADDAINSWVNGRPVFKHITNTTNETVLVPVLSDNETSTVH